MPENNQPSEPRQEHERPDDPDDKQKKLDKSETPDRISLEEGFSRLCRRREPSIVSERINIALRENHRKNRLTLFCNGHPVEFASIGTDLVVQEPYDAEGRPRHLIRAMHAWTKTLWEFPWEFDVEGLDRLDAALAREEQPQPQPQEQPQHGSGEPVEPSKGRGGRKPGFKRGVMQSKCICRFVEEGFPDDGNISQFSQDLLDWYVARYPNEEAPEQRTVREYVGNWRKDYLESTD
jgi:hypothetical protein